MFVSSDHTGLVNQYESTDKIGCLPRIRQKTEHILEQIFYRLVFILF